MAKMLRTAYGEALVKLARQDGRVVVCDADVAAATMTKIFKEAYPERFFDFGIAEQNMVCAAAGMAHAGLVPFVSTFAIFGAGRAFEQIRNGVCYSNANVKLACTHPGISVGEDGGTHQAVEDIALMRAIPGMTILSPCDCVQTEKAVFAAAQMEGPVYLRISRQASPDLTDAGTPFEIGKAQVLREGSDVCVMATGLMVAHAMEAARRLQVRGISCEVANIATIKPIDRAYILSANERFRAIVVAEEHSVLGGLGGAVAEVLAGHTGAAFGQVGIEDRFGRSGTPEQLFEAYGLTPEHIEKTCLALAR